MESLLVPSRNYYRILGAVVCNQRLTMKLQKRTIRAFPFNDKDFRPSKRLSEKPSRSKMDIEYDCDEDLQIVPFQGVSSASLGFFDEEECTNKFTLDPLFNDASLLKSHERRTFFRFLYEMLKFHQVSLPEIRRRMSDPDYLEKAYHFLALLCRQNCITAE